MNKQLLKLAANAGAGPVTLIVTGIGFFCDFVKPMINIIPYFLVFSLVLTVVWWLIFVRKNLKKDYAFEDVFASRHGKIFGMFVISTVYWLILVPVFFFTPEKGIAATVSPVVADWQSQVLGKLDVLEQKIDLGFEKVLAKIEAVDANAGLVGDPKTPNDYYHNARIHELDGNLVEARKAYEKYFEAGFSYFDPYLSYASILKNLEGPTEARVWLGKLRDQYGNSAAANLVYVLNKENREDRLSLLQNLAGKYPDYGPIYFYIAEQYSYKETGLPTNEERKKERDALNKLVELEKSQKFSGFFVDKKLVDEKMAYVQQELKLMEGIIGGLIDNPVSFKVEIFNKSASLVFVPTELVQKIYYRLDRAGDFKETGDSGITMAGQTGTLPNYQVNVPMTLGEHVLEMKYVDNKGKESQVFEHNFVVEELELVYPPYKMIDPKTSAEQYMVSWNLFDSGKEYAFYYSVDGDALDKKVEYVLYLTGLAPGKHKVYVQGVSAGAGAGVHKTNIASMEFEVI